MQELTDFADLAVVLPLAICVALWLGLLGWVEGARLWVVAFGTLLVVMTVLKLGLLGCGPSESPISSPSGHTASSCFVYGGIAALTLRGRWSTGAAMGFVAALLFGISRVAVHAHSVAEVVVGGAVGVLTLGIFLRKAGPAPPGLHPERLFLAILPLMLVLHGARLNVEPRLRGVAFWLGREVCRTVP